MFTIVLEYAPDVLTVWSPNFDLKPNQTDYWPGSDYVDYVGTSVYFKGNGYNSEIPSTYVIDSIATIYTDYAQKYNKRFYISEASGGWEVGQPSAVTQLQFQQVCGV
ncbi:hypothetical protein HDU82_007833 [Entophlyctis luteolus]|nr:hypothetical protein HDU82_007833 [Entophlyctis luteolus]